MLELARMEDMDSINRIACQVHNLHVQWRPDIYEHIDAHFNPKGMDLFIREKELYVLKKESIVAYVRIHVQEQPHSHGMIGRKVLFVEELGMDEKYLGRGLGRQVMNAVERLGVERGCTDMELYTAAENTAAQAFYEHIGMRKRMVRYQKKI